VINFLILIISIETQTAYKLFPLMGQSLSQAFHQLDSTKQALEANWI